MSIHDALVFDDVERAYEELRRMRDLYRSALEIGEAHRREARIAEMAASGCGEVIGQLRSENNQLRGEIAKLQCEVKAEAARALALEEEAVRLRRELHCRMYCGSFTLTHPEVVG